MSALVISAGAASADGTGSSWPTNGDVVTESAGVDTGITSGSAQLATSMTSGSASLQLSLCLTAANGNPLAMLACAL